MHLVNPAAEPDADVVFSPQFPDRFVAQQGAVRPGVWYQHLLGDNFEKHNQPDNLRQKGPGIRRAFSGDISCNRLIFIYFFLILNTVERLYG